MKSKRAEAEHLATVKALEHQDDRSQQAVLVEMYTELQGLDTVIAGVFIRRVQLVWKLLDEHRHEEVLQMIEESEAAATPDPEPDQYPLDVMDLHELDGGWVGWWSKGHHDRFAFIEAVREENAGGSEKWRERWAQREGHLRPTSVRHEYRRFTLREGRMVAGRADGPGPGAFPVTSLTMKLLRGPGGPR